MTCKPRWREAAAEPEIITTNATRDIYRQSKPRSRGRAAALDQARHDPVAVVRGEMVGVGRRNVIGHDQGFADATLEIAAAGAHNIQTLRTILTDFMPHLSHSFSGALRQFSYWIANGSVGHPLLEGIDYSCIFREPSALEQVYAIFANVIEVDENGRVER